MIEFPLDPFFDTNSIDKAMQLREEMSSPRFFVKDTGLKYRVINHWDEEGLIHCNRNGDGGDRKFNFADYVWIKVVEELRSFGVPIPTIKMITDEVYEQLPMKEIYDGLAENLSLLGDAEYPDKEGFIAFLKNKEYENADFSDFDFPFLHLFLSNTITGREALSIIVFNDGEWFPFIPSKEQFYPEEMLNKKKYSSHISICLLDIVFRFLSSDFAEKALKDLNLLSEKEKQLLEEIDADKYKKVVVSFKSKKQAPIELKKGKKTKEQLIAIIRNKEYKDFFITDNKGIEHKVK
jgi:DNA-binding transcriptional MerR regulator